jgi:acyl carrier protein
MNQKNIDEEVKKIFIVLFKLKKNNIKLSTNFKNTKKWDSLQHIKLIMSIESKFKISIEPDEALRLLSFKDIVNFIKKNTF